MAVILVLAIFYPLKRCELLVSKLKSLQIRAPAVPNRRYAIMTHDSKI